MIFGFILGFIFALILITISYLVIRKLIFRFGNQIVSGVEKELSKLQDKTLSIDICYPDLRTEIFNKEGSQIDDLISK